MLTCLFNFEYYKQISMKRPFERNPNRPLRPPTLLQNKKNKPINNKTMDPKNNQPANPIPSTPKYPIKLIQSPLEDKQNEKKSQDETKSTQEDEDCPLFTSRLPCTRINPQLVQYQQEIVAYVKKRQEAFRIDPSYLRNHQLLTPKMRRYLVRHLFKISRRFELQRSTLHLAVHYMDLYFQRRNQFKDQLETVSIAQACLFIAMKYEEIYPPQLGDWIDQRYRYEIFKLEGEVLKTLDYQLAHYTLQSFMWLHVWQIDQGDEIQMGREQVREVMLLLMDMTLFDLNLRQCRYSELAECIYGLTNGVCESKLERGVVQRVKWMVEQNQQTMNWFSQNGYFDVNLASLG